MDCQNGAKTSKDDHIVYDDLCGSICYFVKATKSNNTATCLMLKAKQEGSEYPLNITPKYP